MEGEFNENQQFVALRKLTTTTARIAMAVGHSHSSKHRFVRMDNNNSMAAA